MKVSTLDVLNVAALRTADEELRDVVPASIRAAADEVGIAGLTAFFAGYRQEPVQDRLAA